MKYPRLYRVTMFLISLALGCVFARIVYFGLIRSEFPFSFSAIVAVIVLIIATGVFSISRATEI